MSAYLLAIDTGTQSTRVSIVDEEGNEVLSAARSQVMDSPQPGWAAQRPSMWWKNTVESIKEISEEKGFDLRDVVGIGVCGQMHGSVAIDKKGELIDFPVPLWCDKRESEGLKSLTQDQIDFSYDKTGNLPLPAWVGFKMQWIKENVPDVYGKTDKFIVPKDFLNYMLTGEIATDPTEASGFYTYDAYKEDWSEELTDLLELDSSKLPQIIPSYERLGVVKDDVGKLLGLPDGLPVATGAADFLCHHLASGTNAPGQAMDLCGTSGCFSVVVEKPLRDRRLSNLRHITDAWISFGILDAGGGCLRWLRDSMCVDLMKIAKDEGKDPYEIMIKEAQGLPPGTDGLFFLPYLQGERVTGSPHSRGVFFGISSYHKRRHLIHAVLEGVVLGLKHMVEIGKDAGAAVDEIRFIGGCARSEYWSQMRADCYDVKISTMKSAEGGIMGAAILAGCAAGLFDDPFKTAERKIAKITKAYSPVSGKARQYSEVFTRFLELHDDFQKFFINFSE